MQAEVSTTSIEDPGADVARLDLDRAAIWECFQKVRQTTEALCEPLEIEDYVIQSMADASPAKWHLAHTSWFFETFILAAEIEGFQPVDPRYGFLFNSYYNALGQRIARDRRGLLSRPTVAEVYQYRSAINDRVREFLDHSSDTVFERVRSRLILGLHHEQQHQELIVTDIKHALASNPLRPVYRERGAGPIDSRPARRTLRWTTFEPGTRQIVMRVRRSPLIMSHRDTPSMSRASRSPAIR